MAKQFRIKRQVISANLTENGVVTFDLPRGYDLETLLFRVSGTANVTTAGSAVRALAPTQLIKRVEIIADGKNTIASVPGWYLRQNIHRRQAGLMTPPSNFTIAAYNVEFSGSLDQCLVDGVRPKDSNLRTAGMTLFQLRVTTGALTDLFTGTPAGSMTTFQLEVSTVETVELPDDKGVMTNPLYLQKRSYQDIAIPATNANQQIILPIGNAMRGLLVLATVNGEPSNAVLNKIQLASGVDVRVNMSALAIQRENATDYDPLGILSNSSSWASSSGWPTGLYSIDLMQNGGGDVNVTNSWDLTKASEAKAVVDVNGGAGYQLTIVSTEFIS